MVLFIILCDVVLPFESADKVRSVAIQIKVTEQNCPNELFIILYNVLLTPESVSEILKCDHSNESY